MSVSPSVLQLMNGVDDGPVVFLVASAVVYAAAAAVLLWRPRGLVGAGGSDGLYVQQRPVDSRVIAYAIIWAAPIGIYLLLARVLRAPYARVLEGIRGNEQRCGRWDFRHAGTSSSRSSCSVRGESVRAGGRAGAWRDSKPPGPASGRARSA